MKKVLKLIIFGTLAFGSLVGCEDKTKTTNNDGNNSQVIKQDNNGDDGFNTNSDSDENKTDPAKGTQESNNKLVKSLTFRADSFTIAVNRGYQIEYDIKPFNAENKKLRWSSSDTLIATVNEAGKVSAVGEGTAVISATTMDGSNITASMTFNVYPIVVNDISIDITSKNLKVGDSFRITASIAPANASYQGITFTSEDETVATVDDNGYVTAVAVGETDIVVSSEKYLDKVVKCHVKVNLIQAEKMIFRFTDIEMKQGENFFFNPTVYPTNLPDRSIAYTNNNPNVVSVSDSGEIYALAPGEAIVTATCRLNSDLVSTLKVTVKEKNELVKAVLPYTCKDFANNNYYNVDNANYKYTNALIVPIWFNDSATYIVNRDVVREDIEKAYLGSNGDTGWRSVKTFYEEEGRGRYSFTGVVTDWFECGMNSSSFYTKTNNSIVTKAVDWYKKTYGVENMKGFDADGNGYIDAVILIYGSPDYSALEKPNASNMWAYTSWVLDENLRDYENPGPNVYFWASYDFMYGYYHPHNAKNYFTGNTYSCSIDTHTYIHEYGHVLGLNDYYDYSGQYCPAGGFSMQDHNVGSHDPYSCMILGFVDPYIVNQPTTITISDFQSSGDVILLSNREVNSPYDEYFLLELYTPTGLNAFDVRHKYSQNSPKGLNEVGIRIWHVDARLVYGKNSYDFYSNHITTNPLIAKNKVWYMMSNTYYSEERDVSGSILGRDYMDYNELQLIRNNTEADYRPTEQFASDCLFKEGSNFSVKKFSKQFVKQNRLNDGSYFSFNVEVKKIEDNKATLQITNG